MEKIELRRGRWPKKPTLPDNINEFVNRPGREAQKKSANKVNRWLYDLLTRGVVGGVPIGKYYATLILDISYQGSDIYIDLDGNMHMGDTEIKTKKDLEKAINEKYEVVDK